MTANPATDWLDAQFEQIVKRYRGRFRRAPGYRQWTGPAEIQPMIELKSVTDAGSPMRVFRYDYDDPDGRLL
jgi:hypothetical protein